MQTLSIDTARRVALAAQGLTRARPAGRVDRRHLRRVFDDVGVVQLDSVNVCERAHHMLVWARLGAHDRELLDRYAYRQRPAEVFEAWAHESSLVPVDHHPLLRWRMKEAEDGRVWRSLDRLAADRPGFVEEVLAEVAERGPLAGRELSEPGTSRGPWWGWNDTKMALEWLFRVGRLVALRRGNFERVYELPDRVIDGAVLEAPTPTDDDARRELLLRAARHLGVATVTDLADYHRIRNPVARPLVAELVEEGALIAVDVQGWTAPAYLHPEAVAPRRASVTTLVSPFDPLVWTRDRAERLFGFRYTIEIYVPATKRRWGYYVLPFLHDGRLQARVDLKADRRDSALLVQAAWIEPGEEPGPVADALGAELRALAGWLGLDDVIVAGRGDLAGDLQRVPAVSGRR